MLLLGEVLNDACLHDYSLKVLFSLMFSLAIILIHFFILLASSRTKIIALPLLFSTRIDVRIREGGSLILNLTLNFSYVIFRLPRLLSNSTSHVHSLVSCKTSQVSYSLQDFFFFFFRKHICVLWALKV